MQAKIWLVCYFLSCCFLDILHVLTCAILFFLALLVGSFLDTAAEEQRVGSRVEVLLRLARENDSDFWANEDRTDGLSDFRIVLLRSENFLSSVLVP